MFKALLIVLLATAVFSYETEGNVLVLHDDDFPKVLEQFDYIMIEFYAPWCGHCKKLAPTYAEVADELAAQNSPIKLAKVDATVDSKAGAKYQVQGYPTIFFFHKGEKIDYKGQRSKEYLLNWLLKKTRDPLVAVDQAAYEKLQSEEKVSIVFHGDVSSERGKTLKNLAVADDYNTYYVAQVGKPEGTVEIFRPFDQVATLEPSEEKNIGDWIRKNERPLIVSFDDRTIGDVFSGSKNAVCLFNKANSNVLLDAFSESAKKFLESADKELIFTHIEHNSEHLGPFGDYIKINPEQMAIVLIEPKIRSKFVLVKNASDLTSEDITQFLQNWVNGEATKYGMTDTVEVEAEEAKEEAAATEQL